MNIPGYRVENEAEVSAFLQQHPELVPLLNEARPVIERYFPGNNVVLGFDNYDDWPKLWGVIQTSLTAEKAVETMDRFDFEWWLGRLTEVAGLLNFNLGFTDEDKPVS